MIRRFEGRSALVTGGASGIGRAIAGELLAEGARVLVADRDGAGLAALPEDFETIEIDLAAPDAPGELGRRAEEMLGGVDVLVNNHGLMRQTPALEITVDEWDELFAVNLRAVFFLTQAVAGPMAERGRGSVVSVSSVNAFRSEAPEVHYNATKAGIVSVMRSFAVELSHRGVRFNCVAPGETVSADEATGYTEDDRARTREYLRRVPLRRVGQPVDMARAVCFLASDDAAYVNGQTIVVDGGELAGDWYDTAKRPPVPERLAGIDPGVTVARPLDDIDRRIIDQLQEEGRRPYTEIARAVGISEASVRQRVASLTERGVIQIVAATSPIALGMIQSFISIRLSGGRLERAAEQIAAISEVDYVAVCTGPTDLLVGAVCRDNQHLLEVTSAIREIEGVAETDTAVILSELKDSYRFSDSVRAGQPAAE